MCVQWSVSCTMYSGKLRVTLQWRKSTFNTGCPVCQKTSWPVPVPEMAQIPALLDTEIMRSEVWCWSTVSRHKADADLMSCERTLQKA